MSKRTQIVCLHEGKHDSIDAVFINKLLKTLNPSWLRPWSSNKARFVPKGGRANLISEMPVELRTCLSRGGDTTLMVWADLDHDMDHGDELKEAFWREAEAHGITEKQFESVVFIFAKDRLENWIEYLIDGTTNENVEGPRVKEGRKVAASAKVLAERCKNQQTDPPLPRSLEWSCRNWRKLVTSMS